MIPRSRDAQRATLRRQLLAALSDLEDGALDGAVITIARGESARRLERVRSDRDERALRAVLRLLAAMQTATNLAGLAGEVEEACAALGLRTPADAQEMLRAWSMARARGER